MTRIFSRLPLATRAGVILALLTACNAADTGPTSSLDALNEDVGVQQGGTIVWNRSGTPVGSPAAVTTSTDTLCLTFGRRTRFFIDQVQSEHGVIIRHASGQAPDSASNVIVALFTPPPGGVSHPSRTIQWTQNGSAVGSPLAIHPDANRICLAINKANHTFWSVTQYNNTRTLTGPTTAPTGANDVDVNLN
jgi:hypothetical protein